MMHHTQLYTFKARAHIECVSQWVSQMSFGPGQTGTGSNGNSDSWVQRLTGTTKTD